MSLSTIEIITNVAKHPNADLLDVVTILGYESIVKKDEFKVGEKVVFIYPDTVLPDKPWAAFFKAKSSRVKSIKLRKYWSEGIVFSPKTLELNEEWFNSQPIGTEISETLGVVKYEPALVVDSSARGGLPFNIPKTDEERYENIRNKDEVIGKFGWVTLKVDGKSSTFYCVKKEDGEWVTGITSRSLDFRPDVVNDFSRVNEKYSILSSLEKYCKDYDVSLALRGEVYGKKIQNFPHNPHAKREDVDFMCYSVYNVTTHKYERIFDQHFFLNVATLLGIPHVPIVEKCFVNPDLYKKYSTGIETLDYGKGPVPFEGVVVNYDDGSFKIINKHYDANKTEQISGE